jgi:protein involved in polysaccharide export with SLBB domain
LWAKSIGRLLIAACLSACIGCARTARVGAPDSGPSADKAAPAQAPDGTRGDANSRRLAALWQSRAEGQSPGDYPIGPGDVVQVSVPAIAELSQRTARVSGEGTIALPMIGAVHAGGLTEEELREEISHRLEKYMYQPQVEVFVTEYRSRQVAVVGAVKTPGLLTLTSRDETVLEVITRAGGMTSEAADQIVLIPGEQNAESGKSLSSMAALAATDVNAAAAGEAARLQTVTNRAIALAPASAQPVVISLHSTSLSGAGRYLALRVRPADVIVVPGGGDVMVVGWVQNPGHFQVGSGLTVLGAIGAAGGPMYAADLHGIKLIRTDRDGVKRVIPIDLDNVSRGTQPDLPVLGNDVIQVPYSSLKIGPYIFYTVLTKMGYGFGFPVP